MKGKSEGGGARWEKVVLRIAIHCGGHVSRLSLLYHRPSPLSILDTIIDLVQTHWLRYNCPLLADEPVALADEDVLRPPLNISFNSLQKRVSLFPNIDPHLLILWQELATILPKSRNDSRERVSLFFPGGVHLTHPYIILLSYPKNDLTFSGDLECKYT